MAKMFEKYAADHEAERRKIEKTVAAIIHEWVQEHLEEVNG